MAGSADALVVETTRLTKIYQNRQIAINDVSLTIEPGCVLGLLGPNGAGKTTLLRLILGLHRPTAGTVRVFGRRMTTNAAGLRCRIGYIPTNPQFPRGMTPISYLDYMARLFGLPRDVRKPRLASLIRAVDLLNASGDSIDRFSNGMTARLAVAASLINEPELLIWDEPTHGLDIWMVFEITAEHDAVFFPFLRQRDFGQGVGVHADRWMIYAAPVVVGCDQQCVEPGEPFALQAPICFRKPHRGPGRRPGRGLSVGERQFTLNIVQIQHDPIATRP